MKGECFKMSEEKDFVTLTDEELTKNMAKLPGGLQVSIVNCCESLQYYGTWGVLKDTDEDKDTYSKALVELGKDEKYKQYAPTVYTARNGYVLDYKLDVIKNATRLVMGGKDIITPEWEAKAKARKQEAYSDVVKFVTRAIKGKAGVVKGNTSSVIMGLYGLNASNVIHESGTDFPVFKITLADFVAVMTVSKLVPYIAIMSDKGLVPMSKLINENGAISKAAVKTLVKASTIAESGNGVLFKVQFMVNTELKAANPFAPKKK